MKAEQIQRLFQPLKTLLANIITLATVKSVDSSQPIFTIMSNVRGKQNPEKIPLMQQFGFASVPPANSQTVRAHLSSDPDNPLILATLHEESQPIDLVEGDSILFDNRGQFVKITENGIKLFDKNGQSIELTSAGILLTTNAGTSTIKPDGSVEFANGAKITDDGDFKTPEGISLRDHTHIGNMGSPTGPPLP